MKRFALPAITLLALAACADSSPLQPESHPGSDPPVQSAAEPAATLTVSVVSYFSHPVVIVPRWTAGRSEIEHTRGTTYAWDVTGSFEGTAEFGGHWRYKDDMGPGHGPFVMETTAPCQGTFVGNWHGVMDPDFHGKMVGQGKGGCKGMTFRIDFSPVTPGNMFVLQSTGVLHISNP